MRTRTIILAGVLVIVILMSVYLVAHRPTEPPAQDREIGMTGWPVRRLSPEEEQENHRRAVVALRERLDQQEQKVLILRQAVAANAEPAVTEALAKQEKILAFLRERLEDDESANKPSHRTDGNRADAVPIGR